MSKAEKKISLELFFRALADSTRLRVLNLLGDDEVCVCFLVEILQTNQPNISRHLAYLKRAGVVGTRREGKWMHYRITRPTDSAALKILSAAEEMFDRDEQMKRDRQSLQNVCCVK